MAKIYHPDVNHSPNAQLKFIEIKEAYDFLLNYHVAKYLDDEESFEMQSSQPDDDYFYEWIKHNREKARKQAAYEANMKFQNFKKTKTYRTTIIFNKITNYLIFFTGLLIIFGAFYGLFIRGLYIFENGKEVLNIDALVAVISITFVGTTISVFSVIFHKLNR